MQSRFQTNRARALRETSNDAERKAWRAIRAYAKGVVPVRRQHPVGRFFLDFYCPQARLALELDGSSHIGNEDYDHWRTVELERLGITVVRADNRRTDAGSLDWLGEWFVGLCLERINATREESEPED